MRSVRNEGLYFTKDMYNKIREVNGEMFLEIKDRDITPEEKEIIERELYRGTNRPTICKKLGITETSFNKFLQIEYKTKKISDIRDKLFAKYEKVQV